MDITLLTTTFYKSTRETRFHLACQMIGNAVGAGYQVLVVDGSPDVAVGQALMRAGAHIYHQQGQGMGPSRRQVFGIAHRTGPGIFLWLEPEKVDLVRSIPEIIAPIKRGEANIVIPERSTASWMSYPVAQMKSESVANEVYWRVTNRRFDAMFGPVALDHKVVDLFATCNPVDQFGAQDGYVQLFAPLTAMTRGYKVTSVSVDFYYPPVQKVQEEFDQYEEMLKKRQWQLDQLVDGWQKAGKELGLPLAK